MDISSTSSIHQLLYSGAEGLFIHSSFFTGAASPAAHTVQDGDAGAQVLK